MKRLFMLALFSSLVASAWAENRLDGPQPNMVIALSDEVTIQQEKGRYTNNKPPVSLGAPAKATPEGATTGAVPAGATSPNTCDSKNATSPSCYTATQQRK